MKMPQIKINVNFKIIPFGYVSIEIKVMKRKKRRKKKNLPYILSQRQLTHN